MKYFGKRGVPRQEKELPPPPPSDFARRFVSSDGEPTIFIIEEEAQKENTAIDNTPTTSPTFSCSDGTPMLLSSSLSSLLECGSPAMIDQALMLEPATTVLQTDARHQKQQQQQEETPTCIDTIAVCTAFDTEALKMALLLDDDHDGSSLVMPDSQQQQQQQARSKSLPAHHAALLDHDVSLMDDSTVDFDLYRRLNKSDTDLCDGESPGALRLTEEGLKRHERKTLDFQHNGQYVSSGTKRGLSAIRLARAQTKLKKGGLLAKSLDSVQQFMDTKEQVRIEKLRQKEIARQRKREAQANRALPSKILHVDESSVAHGDAGIEVMNEPMLRRKKKNAPTEEEVCKATKKLSTSVNTCPCIVCSSRERTHIAVPCMHFSFCEPCAKILRDNQWACPVCGTRHTTYNQVFA